MKFYAFVAILTTLFSTCCFTLRSDHAADGPHDYIRTTVDSAIRAVMAKDNIPGIAVGIVVSGRTWVFNYGVESIETRKPVTRDTLFELGSVTKTLTATLASWAQVNHRLSLSDKVAQYLPSMRNTPFGNVSLLNLGTHTPGGLPLQVPSDIENQEQLIQYFRVWRPSYAPGTYRTYSNLGIGILGVITAQSMGHDFIDLMEQHLFPALGMKNSFINVPASRASDYAQGYTREGAPVRMSTGVLSSEAYGVKSTAADMIRFVEANMHLIKLDEKLQRAVRDTRIGYFKAGAMTQDLIWEQYPYPVALKTVSEGNSPTMIINATPVTEIQPPEPPSGNVWVNKTGSTAGFGAYVAFIPQKRLGLVILANKSYPIEDRVSAAYEILTSLAVGSQ